MHPSPNIQNNPDIYEVENRAADPDGLIEATMKTIASWDNKIMLDLGAGTGFHIARFHETARHVIAVEPHDASRLRAMARVAASGLTRTSVMAGSAEHILLPDQCIDVVHVRFAYFFGQGCEPGLRELARVIRPGETAFIIDNDLRTGTFASWIRRVPWFAETSPDEVEHFWANQGFTLHRIASEWRFDSRDDLEAVVHIEFPDELTTHILHEHQGTTISYHYCLYSRRY
ncbi:MAG TPA: SAM-dependent methyltransferase [Ktedonobacter sp.]|nr:SAM-dependent methyltransferase [Ktedonobacter sp.]